MKLHVDDTQKYLVIDECSQIEYDHLCISYNKDVKNARFSPQFKSGSWDGKINFLKNERVCVEKCRFYSRSIYAQYDLHEKATDSIWNITRKSNVQEDFTMENEKVIMTESKEFKDTVKKLNSMLAKEIAEMAENGNGSEDDFAAAGLMCRLLVNSVNVVNNLESRINELSEEIERLKRSKKVNG